MLNFCDKQINSKILHTLKKTHFFLKKSSTDKNHLCLTYLGLKK